MLNPKLVDLNSIADKCCKNSDTDLTLSSAVVLHLTTWPHPVFSCYAAAALYIAVVMHLTTWPHPVSSCYAAAGHLTSPCIQLLCCSWPPNLTVYPAVMLQLSTWPHPVYSCYAAAVHLTSPSVLRIRIRSDPDLFLGQIFRIRIRP